MVDANVGLKRLGWMCGNDSACSMSCGHGFFSKDMSMSESEVR